MNLSKITPFNKYSITNCVKSKSALSEINTACPTYLIYEHIDGSIKYVYHVNIIKLLDRLFTYDYYDALSVEQEKFIKRFLKEADNTSSMSEEMKQLDSFLGGYIGVENGRYSR